MEHPIDAQEQPASPAKTLDKVVLQLTWHHKFQFAGYYAAQLKGFYAEEGLEVEIRERNPNQLPVDAVLSEEADFGNATSDIVLLRMQGKPVVVLACIMQHSPWTLLVRADSGIATLDDLIGKTVSMDMNYRDVEILAMFKDEHISTEKMTLVKKGPGVENLINGAVDARASYLSDQPFALREKGFESRVIRPINYGIDFYGDTLFTSERQIHKHPERVAAFRRASLRGWQYAMEHPEELIDYILATYYADPRPGAVSYSREHLRYEATVMEEDLMHPVLVEIGHVNRQRWRRIADTYADMGMGEPIGSLDDFLYDPNPKPEYRWLYWALGLLVGVAFVGTLAKFWNKRLHRAVTQRTRELRESSMKHERLVNNLIETFLYRHDLEGVFKYVSPSVTQVLGHSTEEFLTHFTEYLTDHPVNQEVEKHTEQSINGIPQPPYEVEIYHMDGTKRWLEMSETPVWDENGKVEAVEGVAHDITNRKRVEQTLRRLNKQLRASIDQMPIAYILWDAEFRAIEWNASAERIFGYTKSEMVGKHVDCIVPEPVRPLVHEVIEKLLNGEETSYSQEGNNIRKDGGVISCLWYNGPMIDETGTTFAVLSMVIDITERTWAEKELDRYREHLEELVHERTQELETTQAELVRTERLTTLGRLTATVAHEIRNPLGTVRNAVFSIGDALERNETERITRATELAERNIQRCDRIITELLDFTRKRKLSLHLTDMDSWLEGVMAEFEFPKGIEYRCELHSGVHSKVDREHLRRAVMNIVTNAVQALQEDNSPGSRLAVETRATDTRIEMRFIDTGPGIPEEILTRIYEPLFSTRGFGVGLGIPIIEGIMKDHGGGVEYESCVGSGTTVTAWLPRRDLEE